MSDVRCLYTCRMKNPKSSKSILTWQHASAYEYVKKPIGKHSSVWFDPEKKCLDCTKSENNSSICNRSRLTNRMWRIITLISRDTALSQFHYRWMRCETTRKKKMIGACELWVSHRHRHHPIDNARYKKLRYFKWHLENWMKTGKWQDKQWNSSANHIFDWRTNKNELLRLWLGPSAFFHWVTPRSSRRYNYSARSKSATSKITRMLKCYLIAIWLTKSNPIIHSREFNFLFFCFDCSNR